ncbi:MAG: hypothetical protein KF850_34430 [Labilithrix sp.]|nr:hypothetical protein [Labilithrix sp.]MBX3217178.1 hypothetical protein [Labilithrix sp.]
MTVRPDEEVVVEEVQRVLESIPAWVRTAAELDAYFDEQDDDAKVRLAAVRRGPRRATTALMGHVLDVLDAFPVKMSTRQLYYQLVSRGAVENTPRSYERVQRLLVQMRRDGDVPYERIVDRTRTKHQRPGWDGVADIMQTVQTQYRRDLWADQRTVVMIACEKQALEGVLSDVVDDYGAPLWILRGFNSESFAFEWATDILDHVRAGKQVVVAFFGDMDPSGLAIERDAKAKLERHGAHIQWERHGLLLADFERFELVNVPVKRTDSRAARYLDTFGDRAAELDALPPDELHRRVKSVIETYLDDGAWHRLRQAEEAERESLSLVTKHWPAAASAARTAAARTP